MTLHQIYYCIVLSLLIIKQNYYLILSNSRFDTSLSVEYFVLLISLSDKRFLYSTINKSEDPYIDTSNAKISNPLDCDDFSINSVSLLVGIHDSPGPLSSSSSSIPYSNDPPFFNSLCNSDSLPSVKDETILRTASFRFLL